MTHHVAGFSSGRGRGRGARASERFDGAIGGDPARARSSEDVRSASHASSTDRSGRRSRALGRSIRARIAQLEKHTVVEGLLGSGFAGTLRACRDARYAPACRRRIGGAPRGSRSARGRSWPGRERRRSVGRRPGGRRPARARSREREQPSRFAVRACAVWWWITACARTNESVRALKAPCDDAIRRCSLLRSTCDVDASGV